MSDPVRAVFTGEFWHGASAAGLAYGLRKQGWLVDPVDVRDFVPGGGGGVARAEMRLFARVHQAAYNRAILRSAERHQAHVMVALKGAGITGETLSRLRRQGVRAINFYPDFEFERAGYDRRLLDGYDLTITTKSFHLPTLTEQLGADRVAMVHHGFSPLVHRPVAPAQSEAAFAYDILYVGNASTQKFETMLAVAKAFPGARIRVIGERWAALAEGTVLAPAVLGHVLVGDYYAHEVGRAKINVALHMGPVTKSGWQDLVSTRTFEIPAARGFMLHVDNAELRDLFDVPAEAAAFACEAELIERIAYYLDRADERRLIAERGHARAWRDHSYDQRAVDIAQLVRTRLLK